MLKDWNVKCFFYGARVLPKLVLILFEYFMHIPWGFETVANFQISIHMDEKIPILYLHLTFCSVYKFLVPPSIFLYYWKNSIYSLDNWRAACKENAAYYQ